MLSRALVEIIICYVKKLLMGSVICFNNNWSRNCKRVIYNVPEKKFETPIIIMYN
jgi:hypothetical protein